MSRVTELEKALTTLFRKGTEVGYTETEIDEFLENIDYPKQNEADEADNVNVTVPVNGNVPVTVINNREKADKPPRPRFTPPSTDDAITYFCEQGSSAAEAKSFLDYYAANGWKVGGRATMKNWQAAARNWIRRAGQYSHPQTKQVAAEPATDTISRAAERLASGNFSNLEDAFL